MTEAEEKNSKEPAEAEAAELESAKDLIRLVTNASRVFHSYPSNNQLYLSFADQLGEKFPTHLEEYGELVLAVGQYEFLFKGQIVYQETNVSRSLALKLYRDGVRRVRFIPGLEKEEIVGFVGILSKPIAADSLEDDIVTLMWEQDFSHVKYAVLEEVGAAPAQPGAEEEAQEEGAPAPAAVERTAAPSIGKQAAEQPTTEAPSFKGEYKDVSSEIQEITEQVRASVASLTEDTLQELQERIEQEAAGDVAGRAALVLCDTAIMEKDAEVTARAVALLGQIMRAHIAEVRIASASEILARLKKMLSPEAELSTQETEIVKNEIDKLAELEVLHQLAAVANENVASRNQELRQFLLAWGKEGIVPVTSLAGMVMDDRVVVGALLEMGKDHAESFVQSLRDPNPAAVSVALRMLGEVGDASITPQLRSPLQQSNVEIKLEAIRTLQKLRGQGALELLELVLSDEDPRVRRAAAQAVGCFPGTGAVDLLQQITSEKTFINKALEEKRVVFAALASAGGEGILPILASIVKKKYWFHAHQHNETRACAAYALGLIGTPGAAEVLEPFQDAGPAILRSACRTALSRIASGSKEKANSE